jgi:hypothetical protein
LITPTKTQANINFICGTKSAAAPPMPNSATIHETAQIPMSQNADYDLTNEVTVLGTTSDNTSTKNPVDSNNIRSTKKSVSETINITTQKNPPAAAKDKSTIKDPSFAPIGNPIPSTVSKANSTITLIGNPFRSTDDSQFTPNQQNRLENINQTQNVDLTPPTLLVKESDVDDKHLQKSVGD